MSRFRLAGHYAQELNDRARSAIVMCDHHICSIPQIWDLSGLQGLEKRLYQLIREEGRSSRKAINDCI
jgi:hypothetical protein